MAPAGKNPLEEFNFPLSLYDRPGVALANLLEGEPDAAFRALFSPDELSPKERQDIASRYGKDPVMQSILRVATNPLVIVGTLLAIKYKVMSASTMFEAAEGAGRMAKRLSLNARFFGSANRIFRDFPKLLRGMTGTTNAIRKFQIESRDVYAEGFVKFQSIMNRLPTKQEMTVMGLMKDGAHRAEGYINKHVMPQIAKDMRTNFKGKTLLNLDAIEPKLRNAMNQTVAVHTKLTKKIWRDMPEDARKVMLDDLAGKGGGINHLRNVVPGGRVAKRRGEMWLGDEVEYYLPHKLKGPRTFVNAPSPDRQAWLKTSGKATTGAVKGRQGLTLPDVESISDPEVLKYLNKDVHGGIAGYQKHYTRLFEDEMAGLVRKYGARPALLEKKMTEVFRGGYGLPESQARAVASSVAAAASYGADDVLRATAPVIKEVTGTIGRIPLYETRLDHAMVGYVGDIGPAYAMKVVQKGETESFHKILKREALDLKARDPSGGRYDIYRDSYLPLISGNKTFKQVHQMAVFNNYKLKMWEALHIPKFEAAIKKAPGGKQVHKFLSETLGTSHLGTSPSSLGTQMTMWFYHGALGFNPSPAMKNLLQPIATTMNVFGTADTMGGAAALGTKIPRYLAEVNKNMVKLGAKKADEMAMKNVWPEFMEHIGDVSQLDEIVARSGPAFIKGARQFVQKGKTASLFMFGATERWNRLMTWETAVTAMKKDPALVVEKAGKLTTRAIEIATRAVDETQFRGGVMGIPHGVINLPSPLRQFTQFPMRMVDFLAGSLRYGDSRGLQFGTVGRAMRNSAITYEVGKKMLHTDLSQGLLFGALPTPYEGGPFYPFPFVPPAVGVAGSMASAVLKGDFSRLPGQLAVAVPGGVAARKFLTHASPSRADYSQYGETGRVPVKDKKGKLIGRYTPTQLMARSMGVRTLSIVQEQELTHYLMKQKDILREYRQRYLKAIYANNIAEATKIQKEYRNKYPELGPLRIKRGDLKALEKRKEMTRVQRILGSLPKEHQPLFRHVASTAMADQTVQAMNQGPESFGAVSGF